jgi:hypothetical protein
VNPRLRAVLVVAAILVVSVGAVALAMAATPPTGQVISAGVQPTDPTLAPPPTASTLAPATSSTIQAPGSTTRDPNTFTTGTMAGPIQVRVLGEPTCERDPYGEPAGYLVRYQITNSGPRAAGPVTVQLDLQPPGQDPEPATLALARGAGYDGQVLVPGTGELVTITWQGRTSFPVEVEFCKPDPDDEDAAEGVTTT